MQALTPEIAGRLSYDEDTEGVVIARVRPGSEAARRGLRRGLLITGINRISVKSLSDYEEAIAEIGPGEALRCVCKLRMINALLRCACQR